MGGIKGGDVGSLFWSVLNLQTSSHSITISFNSFLILIMLIRFTVENFLSFKERVDFSLIASPDTHFKHHVVKDDNNPEDIGVLRTSVIYGANASGKSNLINAIDFAKRLIIKGVDKNKNILIKKFKLDRSCLDKPSRIEFEFKCQEKQYAYGFVVNEASVYEEWLFEIGIHKEIAIFERQEKNINFNFESDLLKNISEDEKQRLSYEAKSTRNNLLFLTNTIEREIIYFNPISEWFDKSLVVLFPKNKDFPSIHELFASEVGREDIFLNKLSELLNFFDFDIKIGANNIELSKNDIIPDYVKKMIHSDFSHDEENFKLFLPSFNTVIFKKESELFSKELFSWKNDSSGDSVRFEIREESDGTQRIINLIPMLLQLGSGDYTFIIDEIENSLHTLLINKIFDYVLNHDSIKGKTSQLIATTHDVLLLNTNNLFRKDEIWFVEKNKQGASRFYSLANADIEELDLVKGYLKGRFGAIPLFKNTMSENE